MKRTGVTLAVIFAQGIVVGGLGHQRLNARPEPVTRTVLLKADGGGEELDEAFTSALAGVGDRGRDESVAGAGE